MKSFASILGKNKNKSSSGAKTSNEAPASDAKTPFSTKLDDNLKTFQNMLEGNVDVNIRRFSIGKEIKQAFLINIEGLSDKKIINESILETVMIDFRKINLDYEVNNVNLQENALSVYGVNLLHTVEEALDTLFAGNTIMFVDGENTALDIKTRAWEHRNVEVPQTENVVRGPHEGFTETLRTNTALVRRRIQSYDLKIEQMKIGKRTRTEINILYLKSIADNNIVEEVKARLNAIDIDSILDSGYIEEYIQDAPYSFFPTVGNTEKPDKFAAKLLEGRVGIIVDGSPMALTVPCLFIEGLQDSEDYYSRPFYTSFIRFIRYVSLNITLYLPALYIALTNYHPNLIPKKLLIRLAVTHEGVPFPALAEALLMNLLFEIIREAGVRMPSPVGQAVSIVGALVMGEVAVSAGLVSPLMVIIVASTGIMNFMLNPQAGAIATLRYPVMLISAVFGLFGTALSFVVIIIHLSSLRSFGAPYLSPMAPGDSEGMKDVLIRAPLWSMKKRPKIITWRDSDRSSGKQTDFKRKGS